MLEGVWGIELLRRERMVETLQSNECVRSWSACLREAGDIIRLMICL